MLMSNGSRLTLESEGCETGYSHLELAYATDYLIQASDDKENWKTVATVTGSDGFIDKVFINAKQDISGCKV
jgi:hypothetical protein